MPIHLMTGLPGNGKTALMIEHLMAQAKLAKRPLFAIGIDGLKEGYATVFPEAKDWNNKDENGEYLIPDGSLIYIDEAWKWFGHLQDATRQATPKHVLALAEHRHRGLDFVWTTQMPSQIYPFARALVQDHWHTVRRFGTKMIDVYKWGELVEDVKSASKRELAMKETRTLPTASFGVYQSATEHTIKSKIPFRVLLIPVFFVAAIACAVTAYKILKPENFAAKQMGVIEGSAGDKGAAQPTTSTSVSSGYSLASYLKSTTPVVQSKPWTAPIYAGIQPENAPMLYCMSSGVNGADSCTCLTEQGTVYAIPNDQCRTIARDGLYNPNKQQNSM